MPMGELEIEKKAAPKRGQFDREEVWSERDLDRDDLRSHFDHRLTLRHKA